MILYKIINESDSFAVPMSIIFSVSSPLFHLKAANTTTIHHLINITSEGVFWKAESVKRIRAKEQLDEFIFNAIESLRNGKKQPNENTIHVTINEDLTSATMEQKERLATLLDKKNF